MLKRLPEKMQSELLQQIPLGRIGRREEITTTIALLEPQRISGSGHPHQWWVLHVKTNEDVIRDVQRVIDLTRWSYHIDGDSVFPKVPFAAVFTLRLLSLSSTVPRMASYV